MIARRDTQAWVIVHAEKKETGNLTGFACQKVSRHRRQASKMDGNSCTDTEEMIAAGFEVANHCNSDAALRICGNGVPSQRNPPY